MPRSVKQRHPKRYLVKVKFDRKGESMEGFVRAGSKAEAQREGLRIAKRVIKNEYGPGRTSKHRVVRVKEEPEGVTPGRYGAPPTLADAELEDD
jgi:hypothetical protein